MVGRCAPPMGELWHRTDRNSGSTQTQLACTFVLVLTSEDRSRASGHTVSINCSQRVRVCRVPLVMERRGWIGYRAEGAWPPAYLVVVQFIDWSFALE